VDAVAATAAAHAVARATRTRTDTGARKRLFEYGPAIGFLTWVGTQQRLGTAFGRTCSVRTLAGVGSSAKTADEWPGVPASGASFEIVEYAVSRVRAPSATDANT
jgi:hypothetical protein